MDNDENRGRGECVVLVGIYFNNFVGIVFSGPEERTVNAFYIFFYCLPAHDDEQPRKREESRGGGQQKQQQSGGDCTRSFCVEAG